MSSDAATRVTPVSITTSKRGWPMPVEDSGPVRDRVRSYIGVRILSGLIELATSSPFAVIRLTENVRRVPLPDREAVPLRRATPVAARVPEPRVLAVPRIRAEPIPPRTPAGRTAPVVRMADVFKAAFEPTGWTSVVVAIRPVLEAVFRPWARAAAPARILELPKACRTRVEFNEPVANTADGSVATADSLAVLDAVAFTTTNPDARLMIAIVKYEPPEVDVTLVVPFDPDGRTRPVERIEEVEAVLLAAVEASRDVPETRETPDVVRVPVPVSEAFPVVAEAPETVFLPVVVPLAVARTVLAPARVAVPLAVSLAVPRVREVDTPPLSPAGRTRPVPDVREAELVVLEPVPVSEAVPRTEDVPDVDRVSVLASRLVPVTLEVPRRATAPLGAIEAVARRADVARPVLAPTGRTLALVARMAAAVAAFFTPTGDMEAVAPIELGSVAPVAAGTRETVQVPTLAVLNELPEVQTPGTTRVPDGPAEAGPLSATPVIEPPEPVASVLVSDSLPYNVGAVQDVVPVVARSQMATTTSALATPVVTVGQA